MAVQPYHQSESYDISILIIQETFLLLDQDISDFLLYMQAYNGSTRTRNARDPLLKFQSEKKILNY